MSFSVDLTTLKKLLQCCYTISISSYCLPCLHNPTIIRLKLRLDPSKDKLLVHALNEVRRSRHGKTFLKVMATKIMFASIL